jgi:hypothetical protein
MKFYTRIVKIEHRNRLVRSWKDANGDIQTAYRNLGWFLLLEGSYESLYCGAEEPVKENGNRFQPGDEVEVIIRERQQ